MITFPDTRTMLPSAAKRALVVYYLGKLEAAPLNYRANPSYSETDALVEARVYAEKTGDGWSVATDWMKSKASEAYQEAVREYDRRYPLSWSNEKQCAYRVGKEK